MESQYQETCHSDGFVINPDETAFKKEDASLNGFSTDNSMPIDHVSDSRYCDGPDDLELVYLDRPCQYGVTTSNKKTVEHLADAMETVSLDSIASGISNGSSASEERVNVLKCLTSVVHSLPPPATVCSQKRSIKSAIVWRKPTEDKLSSTQKCSVKCTSDFDRENYKVQRCKSVPPVLHDVDYDNEDSGRNDNNTNGTESSASSTQQSISVKKKNINCTESCKIHKRVRRTDSRYDPTFEKSKTFLHGQGKTFSKANEYLTPARPGLQKIQVSYTQTNTENNYRKLFYDLVKTAHRQNIIISESVRNLERRLFSRRSDPTRATSFYEHKGLRDPAKHYKQKQARTIADKMNERKEKIKQTSEEIKTGYVPTEQTILLPGPEEIERLRSCRYLRVHTKLNDL